uniref:Secreted protein n=1 Tax=Romanomermis culicivorax TaxID=13658 RepID=A0A915KFA6_ROMCU
MQLLRSTLSCWFSFTALINLLFTVDEVHLTLMICNLDLRLRKQQTTLFTNQFDDTFYQPFQLMTVPTWQCIV